MLNRVLPDRQNLNRIILFSMMAIMIAQVNGAVALATGVIVASVVNNPWPAITKKLSAYFLGTAIIGLGANMNLITIFKVGLHGFGYTFVSISLTIALAFILGHMLKIDKNLSLLIGAGTAICGGSAIAAVSSAVKAPQQNTSIALGIVFILNACALTIFPKLGAMAGLSEEQFGLWSALAIHDTSAVVATALPFGDNAVFLATTVKLARTLWIVPLVFVTNLFMPGESSRRNLPWFIVGFVVAAAMVTYFPSLQSVGKIISAVSKNLFSVALFLIGMNISIGSIRSIGWRPLFHGVFLWFVIASITLCAIINHWISPH